MGKKRKKRNAQSQTDQRTAQEIAELRKEIHLLEAEQACLLLAREMYAETDASPIFLADDPGPIPHRATLPTPSLKKAKTLDDAIDYFDAKTVLAYQQLDDDPEKALRTMHSLVREIEHRWGDEIDRMEAEGHTFSFDWDVHAQIYALRYAPETAITKIEFPVSSLYYVYADMLAATGQWTEALAAIQKARRWNPADFFSVILEAEYHKALGADETSRQRIRDALQIASTPEELTIAYDHLAKAYAEARQWPEALGLALRSLKFTPADERDLYDLRHILAQIGEADITPATPETLETTHHIPMTLAPDIQELLKTMAAEYQAEAEQQAEAEYQFDSYYDQILRDLAKMMEEDVRLEDLKAAL